MGEELYRIIIPVEVQDKTNPALAQAEKSVSQFEKSMKKSEERMNRMGRSKLALTISAVDKASAIIGKISSGAASLVRKPFQFTIRAIDLATAPLRSALRFATSVRGILTGMFAGYAFNKMVRGPIALADALVQAEVGFETMLGSAEAAKNMMNEIKAFAIKTPFSTQGIVQQTQRMMAFGWEAQNVLRDMERIGNAAAATGRGEEGMGRIILALGQIRMKGKLSAEELNQLAEAGVRAREYISKGLGVDIPTMSKMAEKGLIDANKAVDLILQGMSEFDGQMDKTATKTLTGLISQIKDTFEVSIIEKWGKGLQTGAIDGLSKLNNFLTTNRGRLDKWGETFEKIGKTISLGLVDAFTTLGSRAARAFDDLSKAEKVSGYMDDMSNSLTTAGKIKFLWDRIVYEPFQEWWRGKGREKTIAIASDIGTTMGGSIGGFLSAALGIASESTGGQQSPFVEAGTTAGKAFFEAFWAAFDADLLADKAKKAFVAVAKDAGTLAPGGKEASGTSALSLLGVGYLGSKAIKGARAVGKPVKFGIDLLKSFKTGFNQGTTQVVQEMAAASPQAAKATGLLDQYGKPIVNTATAGAKTVDKVADVAKVASGVSKGAKMVSKVPALSLLSSGLIIATASKGERGKETAGEVGGFGGLIAGMKLGAVGGAATGSVVPGIGTAAGAIAGSLIGAIGGSIGGEMIAEKIYQKIKSTPKIIDPSYAQGAAYGRYAPRNAESLKVKAAETTQKTEQKVDVKVTAPINIHVKTDADAASVVSVVNQNSKLIADKIAADLANGLSSVFFNMPKSRKVALE